MGHFPHLTPFLLKASLITHTKDVSSVLPKNENLHFYLGIPVGEEREDPRTISVNVTVKFVLQENDQCQDFKCSPDIHLPVQTPALLEYVWSVAAAGQDHYLIHANAQASFDPRQALSAQRGRTEHKWDSLIRGTQPTPQHRRVWPEVPATLGICHSFFQKNLFKMGKRSIKFYSLAKQLCSSEY